MERSVEKSPPNSHGKIETTLRTILHNGVSIQYGYTPERRVIIASVDMEETSVSSDLTEALVIAREEFSRNGAPHATLLMTRPNGRFVVDAVRDAGFEIHEARYGQLIGGANLRKSEDDRNRVFDFANRILETIPL